jgi:hypothetical protein
MRGFEPEPPPTKRRNSATEAEGLRMPGGAEVGRIDSGG